MSTHIAPLPRPGERWRKTCEESPGTLEYVDFIAANGDVVLRGVYGGSSRWYGPDRERLFGYAPEFWRPTVTRGPVR